MTQEIAANRSGKEDVVPMTRIQNESGAEVRGRRSARRWLSWTVAAAAVSVVLVMVGVGCGGDTGGAGAADAGGAGAADTGGAGAADTAEAGAADAAPDGGARIGYITLTGNSYYSCISKGLKAKVEEAGNTYVEVHTDGTPDSELAAAENLAAQDMDVVAVTSVTPRGGDQVVKTLAEAGIKIVPLNIDSYLTDETRPLVETTYAWDLHEMGALAGEIAVDLFPAGTKAAAVEPTVGGIHVIYEGFSDVVKDAGFEWLDYFPARSYSPADVQKATEDLLTRYPDVQVIYTDDTEPVPGIVAAIRQADSDAVIIPNGGRDRDFDWLRDGTIAGLTAAQPYPMGENAGEIVNAIAAGEEPPDFGNPQVFQVTKENVDEIPPFCEPAE